MAVATSVRRPINRRRTIQVLIGAALVVAAFLAVLLVGTLRTSTPPAVTIVGAARDIPVGKVVVADDLKSIQVTSLPTGALTVNSAAAGKLTRVAIKAGQPVLDSDLAINAVQAPAKLYFTLPAGYVALNIPSGDISPYVQPGDEIDILAIPRVGAVAGNPQVKATLKGIKVMAVGSPAAPGGGNLVVAVTLQQAEELQFLIKNTDFTYVLKSPLDASSSDPSTGGVDVAGFKAAFGFK